MLTIFACPKPFTDPHIAIIQRNAITSWTLLRPKPEIILFGDEEGVAEICRELGLRHVPEIARNEFGTPLLNDIFEKAQNLATHEILCYVNADIILMSDFMEAVKRVSQWQDRFLMVGQRWDVDIRELIDFSESCWEHRLREHVQRNGHQKPPSWVDYFVFKKGLFSNIPPFALGRTTFDNWLIWKARINRASVVDASLVVIAVHQNHDYSHVPGGEPQVWQGEEAKRNYQLAGGWTHCYIIADATHRLTPSGIRRNLSPEYFGRRLEMIRRSLIDWTRPIRHRLGLKRPHIGRA
ncbi:MAG: hypothetical protein QXI60_02785 [Thermofilaceae archaeon]